jgi:hypothetical protein
MSISYGICDECNQIFECNQKIIRIKTDEIGNLFKLTFCNNDCCNKTLTKYSFLSKYDNYECTSEGVKKLRIINVVTELFKVFPEYLIVNGKIKKAQEMIELLLLCHKQDVYLTGRDKDFFEYCKNNEIFLN